MKPLKIKLSAMERLILSLQSFLHKKPLKQLYKEVLKITVSNTLDTVYIHFNCISYEIKKIGNDYFEFNEGYMVAGEYRYYTLFEDSYILTGKQLRSKLYDMVQTDTFLLVKQVNYIKCEEKLHSTNI